MADTGTDLALERTLMAAERTLMAWVRTSLALISFGFTLGKLGDVLRSPVAATDHHRHPGSCLLPRRAWDGRARPGNGPEQS